MADPIFVQKEHRALFNWHRHPAFKDVKLTLGQRAADRMRNGMGSWPFVFGFLGAMLLWAGVNTLFLQRVENHKPFDPYPYILLNLLLSTLAGLQGAILLIAAKRSDEIASLLAQHDYETNVTANAKIDLICDHLGISLPKAAREDITIKTITDHQEPPADTIDGEDSLPSPPQDKGTPKKAAPKKAAPKDA